MKSAVYSVRPLPFFIAFLSVTLDLLTTRVALSRGYIETRLFGNNMLLEYSIFLAVVLVLQFLGDRFANYYQKVEFSK